MSFVGMLEDGRADFLQAVGSVPADQAAVRPPDGGWSVLECIEHVIAVEERYLRLIENGVEGTPRRDSRKELRLFTTVQNRMTKVEAPEPVRPAGRFLSLAAAVAQFGEVRDSSVRLVQKYGDGLYALAAKHPFFGDLNGAELLQLIDAHGRRHADQIRETCAALLTPKPARKKTPAAKKTPGFKRDRPDLPSEFGICSAWPGGDDVLIEEKRLLDIEAASRKASNLRIEGSVLERVQLGGAEFGSVLWRDVRFVNCDLANLRAQRMVCVRVEFVDCRLSGLFAAAPQWQDTLVQNGDARFAQLRHGTFASCEFEGGNWEEADLQQADLTGCVVRSCNLTKADFREAKLRNTDLRKSGLDGLIVGMNDLRGAIVSPDQAMVLARLLGLQIR